MILVATVAEIGKLEKTENGQKTKMISFRLN